MKLFSKCRQNKIICYTSCEYIIFNGKWQEFKIVCGYIGFCWSGIRNELFEQFLYFK